MRVRAAGAGLALDGEPLPSGISCAREACWRTPALHGAEGVAQTPDGALPGLTPFPARPALRVDEERAELRDELDRPRSAAVEQFDPLQSLEHRSRLVHTPTVDRVRSRPGNGSGPSLREGGVGGTSSLPPKERRHFGDEACLAKPS